MNFVERLTEDLIDILHNTKNSFIRDASRWHEEYGKKQYPTVIVETSGECAVYETRHRHENDENPSIFGNQPVSEYAQQPIPQQDAQEGDLAEGTVESADEEVTEETRKKAPPADPEQQLSEEQLDALTTEQRKREIERHRSNFDGIPRTQR